MTVIFHEPIISGDSSVNSTDGSDRGRNSDSTENVMVSFPDTVIYFNGLPNLIPNVGFDSYPMTNIDAPPAMATNSRRPDELQQFVEFFPGTLLLSVQIKI